MASTLKVDTITTPDGTGNITTERPLAGSGAGLTSLPAANLTTPLPAISGANLTTLPAANISGVIPAANLGTGTASASTFLRGDGAYAAAGGGMWTSASTGTFSGASSAAWTSLTKTTRIFITNYECKTK